MKRKPLKTACILFVLMALSVSAFPSYAAGPDLAADAETWGALKDGVVEWEEIGTLVVTYNPTYRKYAESAEAGNVELSTAAEAFSMEMDESIATIDSNLKNLKKQRESLSRLPGSTVIDASGTTVSDALASISRTEAALKETRTGIKKGVGKASAAARDAASTTRKSLKQISDPLTKAVESLVISYHQLSINEELVRGQVALYETALSTKESLKEKEMATETDVREAESQLADAKKTLQEVEEGKRQLAAAIGLQTGYGAENPPEIGEVPEADEAYVAGIDKEADLKKALENNKTYETTGKVSSYSGAGAVMQRDEAVNEARAKAEAKFESLYAAVQQQKLLCEASETSLKLAGIRKEQAERMHSLGLTGNAEYQGTLLSVLAMEADAKLTKLSYAAAVNEYRWAVEGIMEY